MKIYVTQEHINRGKKKSCNKCPVALAILDAFPDARSVDADTDTLSWSDNRSYYRGNKEFAITPRSVYRFICRFDAGKEVKPFAFIWKEKV